MARELARQRGLGNVDIVAADARRTGLPSSSFDLVHARTLLVTVPEPAEVVAEMVRLARPDGWAASLEPDAEYSLCYPAHPAWTRLYDIFRDPFSRNGADVLIGRRLTQLYREAGLQDIGVEARAGIYRAGDTRRTVRLDLVRSMRPAILKLGLAGQRELDELDRVVREHLDDPGTLVMPHLSFLAWGRKPGVSAAVTTRPAASRAGGRYGLGDSRPKAGICWARRVRPSGGQESIDLQAVTVRDATAALAATLLRHGQTVRSEIWNPESGTRIFSISIQGARAANRYEQTPGAPPRTRAVTSSGQLVSAAGHPHLN